MMTPTLFFADKSLNRPGSGIEFGAGMVYILLALIIICLLGLLVSFAYYIYTKIKLRSIHKNKLHPIKQMKYGDYILLLPK